MRGLWTCTVAGLLSATAAGLQLAPRSDSPRVISLPIQRTHRDNEAALSRDRNRLRKRQDKTLLVDLDNDASLYFANCTVGTPSQELRLHIDTGSSDLWVNLASSSLCQQGQCDGGVYDAAASSTHQTVNTEFNISYVDGSGASGDYVSDTFGIGDVSLTDFQFGTGQTSSSPQGVLGIGFELNEVQVSRAGGNTYPNLPAALKNAGHIDVNMYSLWLNDLDASVGEILFGGVDMAKFDPPLRSVPIVSLAGQYYELVIALTGIVANGESVGGNSDLPIAVLLDSGSTLSYLPTELIEPIFDQVSAVWNADAGAAYAPCRLADEDLSISFNFSGAVVTVPYNELFLPVTSVPGTGPRFQNGEEACFFGISEADNHIAVFGDTFLRSAYVVYDLEGHEIALANTVFNATNSDIRELASSSDGIPGATPVAHPVTDVDYATNGARLGGPSGSNNAAGALAVSSGFALLAVGLSSMVTAW